MANIKRQNLRDITTADSITSIATTYEGEFAGKYIAAALLSGTTLQQDAITVMPNVKYKSVIQKGALTNVLSDATCDFSTQNDVVTLTERVLQPKELQVNLEICKKDFHTTWQAIEMGYSAFNEIPKSFADFLIAQVLGKVAEEIEYNVWQGDDDGAGSYTSFDGFETLLAADATVIDATYAAITAANVVDQLQEVVDNIPSAVYGKPDLNLYCATNVIKAYQSALGGFSATIGTLGTLNDPASSNATGTTAVAGTTGYQNQMTVGAKPLNYTGINMYHCAGMSDNTIVAAQKDNLFFGTGLLNDQNLVKTLDMADLDGSQNVRMIMRMTAGVLHGIGSDIVLHKSA